MRAVVSAFGGAALLLLAPLAQAQELREVRVWDSPEGTRVVLDLDANTEHELQTLSNPDRVVLDLRGVRRAATLATAIDGKGLVRRVRTGDRDDALRVVLDLTRAASSKSFVIEPGGDYGYRLVVDLTDQATAPARGNGEELAAPAATPVLSPVAAVDVEPSPAAAAARPIASDKPIVIAIDAGHGGEDPGAIGKNAVNEKDVTLSIARKLARRINAESGFKAVLIRDGDYFIPLRGRMNLARQAQADLFVSVHCNASPNREAQGSSVYVLSPRGASNEHARWLAGKENAADLVGGVELQDKDDTLAAVLFDISQTSAMEASIDVGGRVLSGLSKVNNLIKSDVQQAGFAVLKSPDIPSILIETAFISNLKEERLLNDPDYQGQMADSILAGVKDYFESYRPQGQLTADARPAGGQLVDVSFRRGSGLTGASR